MGREKQKMLGENFAPDLLSANTVYSRYSQFTKRKEPIFMVMILNEQGQIEMLEPHPDPPPTGNRYSDYTDKTRLKLPFNALGLCTGAEDLFTRIKVHSVTLNAMP